MTANLIIHAALAVLSIALAVLLIGDRFYSVWLSALAIAVAMLAVIALILALPASLTLL